VSAVPQGEFLRCAHFAIPDESFTSPSLTLEAKFDFFFIPDVTFHHWVSSMPWLLTPRYIS